MWTSLNAAGQSLSPAGQYANFKAVIKFPGYRCRSSLQRVPRDRQICYSCQQSSVRFQLMPAEFSVDSDLSPEKGGQLRKAAHVMHVSVSYSEAQVKNGYCGVEPLGWHIFDTSATDNQILGPAKTRLSASFGSDQLHDNNQL
ncbi:hypothetical protein BCON_0029g00140 [Botryotinia convoluta]|uniref:Uncharacterized protein n=1 Tax=Botryotinia convoluta TaxID=54673 RepID=A0A4Z1IWH5_9HELO|nr:hypothetical protein BCON_0029g00140 [Botryotinia convoluta]